VRLGFDDIGWGTDQDGDLLCDECYDCTEREPGDDLDYRPEVEDLERHAHELWAWRFAGAPAVG
jgi:hypothetical protein